jgi:sugar lactone lactonase YvrE
VNFINFCRSSCTLGEGIYFDTFKRDIYWVDIIESKLYRKNIDSLDKPHECYSVGIMPSAIVSVENNVVTFIDKIGINLFDIGRNVLKYKIKTPYAIDFRANDAVKLNDGSILYGTMCLEPETKAGFIYLMNIHGNIKLEELNFNIPNTFVERENDILISDSLEKKVYSISNLFSEKVKKVIWKDLSDKEYAPDGGCTDKLGNIYISMWDGFCVSVFDPLGIVKYQIELPVPRPTNCILVDERWLYVTSAREGLSDELLRAYPLSGDVLIVDLGV